MYKTYLLGALALVGLEVVGSQLLFGEHSLGLYLKPLNS